MISGLLTFPSVQGNLKKKTKQNPKVVEFCFLKNQNLFTFLPNTAYETSGTSFSLLELQLLLYKIIVHPFIAN